MQCVFSGASTRVPGSAGRWRGGWRLAIWAWLVWVGGAAQAQLPPAESLPHLRPAAGIAIELFAAEPLVANPAAIDVDAQGRVWVAEITRYRKFADQPPADRIKVLEDTDGDGRADRVSVFAEGVYCPMSICVAGPQVFVATSPDLWVYEDRDGNLVADGPPRKLLTGFGGFNHDHGAHSLVLGPDHQWWMSHGDGGFDVTGTDGSQIASKWGAVMRGELDGSRLELVAHNFRNPYEVCLSSFGEAFVSDNDNDGNRSARICWLLEGGDYGWFGGPPGRVPAEIPFSEGWHFRAHQPGYVPGTLVTGFGSPAGMCFYEGTAFGPERANVPWHCDPGPREVRVYPHQPLGYGMWGSVLTALTVEGDDYVRPVDVCAAPDGSLLVADWYDGGVGGHNYNNPEQGRIYRLRGTQAAAAPPPPPGPYHDFATALSGLASPNLATQFLARERILAEGPAGADALTGLLGAADRNLRARALWLLDRLGDASRGRVAEQLTSEDAEFRALAVRILRRRGGLEYIDRLAGLACDPSPMVRRELLLAIGAWPSEQKDPLWLKLAESYDGSDRYQLETLNISAADNREKEALFTKLAANVGLTPERLPLFALLEARRTAEFLVSRLADESLSTEARTQALSALALLGNGAQFELAIEITGDRGTPIALRRQALELLASGLESTGRLSGDKPSSLPAATVGAWLGDPEIRSATIALVRRGRLTELSPALVDLATDSTAATADRAAALEAVGELGALDQADALTASLADGDPQVRQAARQALIRLQVWAPLGQLLASAETPVADRQSLAEAMMATTGGALWLLRNWEGPALDEALRGRVLELAAAHVDAHVRALFDGYLPPGLRGERLGEKVSAQALLALEGDAVRGERVFFESTAAQCQKCHMVRGRGGSLGPDLSQVGRKYERGALLATILDPSAAMAPEYVPQLVETERGQVYLGFLVDRGERELALRDAQGQVVRLPLDQVAEVQPQTKSLMPELVLRDVSSQDAADLLAFLSGLRDAAQPVRQWRLVGPFDNRLRNGLRKVFAPEEHPGEPNLSAEFSVLDQRTAHWEVVAAEATAPAPSFDTVTWDRERGFRTDRVSHYFLTWIESPSEQEARLRLASDDGLKVWLNGTLVHEHRVQRALFAGEDVVTVPLHPGRNPLMIKVENQAGPGGLSVVIESPQLVQLRTD